MILIFSNQKLETTTDKILRYLHRFGYEFIRINIEDIEKTLESQQNILDYPIFNLKFKVVWFRKWSYPFFNLKPAKEISRPDIQNYFLVMDHVKTEWDTFNTFLFSKIDSEKWLSNNSTATPNKLIMLDAARKCRFSLPKYILTMSKTEVATFMRTNKCSITIKPLSDVLIFDDNEYLYKMLSKKIDKASLIPNKFGLSLIQEYIDKAYEVRVFFLNDDLYPMGIFSQSNDGTAEDFRNYDAFKPNRRVPITLPKEIIVKIRRFVKFTNYNTGSIDLLVSKTGDYYFLEINPVGQFGMTSIPCGYNLERKIAEYLIEETKK
jgi:ATP-GRASP peptide maturase of grasp-with-spasm system